MSITIKITYLTFVTSLALSPATLHAASSTNETSPFLWFLAGIISASLAGIVFYFVTHNKTTQANPSPSGDNTFSIANALQLSESRNQALIETISDVVWETDDKGSFTYISPQVENITGYPAKKLLGLHFPCLSNHRSMCILSNDAIFFSALIKQQQPFNSLESWQFNRDGESLVFEISGVPITDAEQNFQGYRGVARNITTRKRTQEELQLEKDRFQVTLESISDGVVRTNVHNCIEYINPAACKLIGVSAANTLGKPLEEIFKAFDEASGLQIEEMVKRSIAKNRSTHFVSTSLLYHERDNDRMNVEVRITPIRNQKGGNIGTIIAFHDISEVKRLTGQMSHQSTHDTLTELFNRTEFERRLDHAIKEAKDKKTTHVLCYLDLDQFNVINETFGHVAGDELLKQIGKLLLTSIRETDIIARIGGDEFGILLVDCDTTKAEELVEKLCEQIRAFRLSWQERTIQIGVSAGLVLLDHNVRSLADVFGAADSACFVAKDLGRNRTHLFQPNDTELAKRHGMIQWMHHIREALKEDRFALYCEAFYPITENAHQVKHYETLVRMKDRSGKYISPMSFIPAAERYHLMPEIDRWVINNTFKTISQALPQSKDTVYTINVSGQSLSDPQFLTSVVAWFNEYQISPKNICFEITETAAIGHFNNALLLIKTLRRMGCAFALDDFGTGLSSFTYLRSLPVQYLKIDGSFVRNIQDDPIDYAMVNTINEIGHLMGLTTIGEYVETKEILEKVTKIGIDYAQGHGVAKTSPLTDIVLENQATTESTA